MKPKKFDCVQMKRDIQEQILQDLKGLTPEEQRRRTVEAIEKDDLLGPLWRSAQRIDRRGRRAS